MILSLLINTVGIFLIGSLLKGVHLNSFFTALATVILLAIVNTFVKPIISFLALPLTIITFGLFILVINAFMLMIVDGLLDGLKIDHWGWALLFSLILSVLNLGFF
ncbi:putative membrane protein [Fodinibius salinus]|uniref:Putative membrane protein n=1 Tax=Fodinibius salinus TaxID=860790 RepID=A0A5D3YFC9_9BACT|nr:phage holin family protein [Fodinibius salinus]TYP92187.1 putative membrane protein [Fodinibius salinus]